jgi:hypothetical protein
MLLYIGPPKSDYCYSVIGNPGLCIPLKDLDVGDGGTLKRERANNIASVDNVTVRALGY